MLINLTNHPVKGVFDENKKTYQNSWSNEQLDAAIALYDEIIELSFPQISPYCNTSEVKELAQEYCNRCVDLLKQPSLRNAVHIGGETMFCYYVISFLLEKGYQVVSASSDRIIENLGENRTIKRFKFVKFRRYE